MTRASLLVLVVSVAFLAGRSQNANVASAAVPNPCPKYECLEWNHWWAGNGDVVITGAYSVVGAVSINVALLDTFSTFSNGKAPDVPGGANYDARTRPACIPLCGFEPLTTKWQAPQTVGPMGPLGVKPFAPDPITFCTVLGTDANGNPEQPPLSDDQSTQANPGWPPGVSKELPTE